MSHTPEQNSAQPVVYDNPDPDSMILLIKQTTDRLISEGSEACKKFLQDAGIIPSSADPVEGEKEDDWGKQDELWNDVRKLCEEYIVVTTNHNIYSYMVGGMVINELKSKYRITKK